MVENNISIAQVLKDFEADMERLPDVLDALYQNAKTLCEKLQSILNQIENLRRADMEVPQSTVPIAADPNTKQYSKEIIAWAIANLCSAWTLWVFTSKSQETSSYQTDSTKDETSDRLASRVNVKIVLPYIRHSR